MSSQPSAPSRDPWLLIVADDPESLAFWACLFEVSSAWIAQAVKQVGGDVHEVDAYLRHQRRNAAQMAQDAVCAAAEESKTPAGA